MEQVCYRCFKPLQSEGPCPHCGFDIADNRRKFPDALPAGSILFGRYIVGAVLGQGGFGITYAAQDYQTKTLMAVKEFFPDTMLSRVGTTAMAKNGEKSEFFEYGLKTFLEEAQTMAEFIGNPNIIRVHQYFEENGSAIAVGGYSNGMGGRCNVDGWKNLMLP